MVDSILLWSNSLCEETLLSGAKMVYPKDVGMDVEESGGKQTILHTDLVTSGDTLTLTPHCHNHEFAQGLSKKQKLIRILPPFRVPFDNRKALIQFVVQMLARSQQTCPNDSSLCEDAMNDLVGELTQLGYSYEQISRAVRAQKRNKITTCAHISRTTLKELAKIEKVSKQ